MYRQNFPSLHLENQTKMLQFQFAKCLSKSVCFLNVQIYLIYQSYNAIDSFIYLPLHHFWQEKKWCSVFTPSHFVVNGVNMEHFLVFHKCFVLFWFALLMMFYIIFSAYLVKDNCSSFLLQLVCCYNWKCKKLFHFYPTYKMCWGKYGTYTINEVITCPKTYASDSIILDNIEFFVI